MKNNMKIYMLAAITFTVSTSEYVIAGILDKVASSAHIWLVLAGQLITVFAIANAIGSPIIIMAMAKFNQRKILILSLLLMVLGCVMTVTLTGFGFLMISRIVLAIGCGVFGIAAKTTASKLASPEKQAGAIGTIILGFSAAIIIGVPIGRVVANAYDWRLIFVGIGALSLISIFVIRGTIPDTAGGTAVPIGKQLAYLRQSKILLGLGITFFWQLGYGVMYSYIAPFLLNVTTLGEKEISTALFAFGIATLAGSKAGGFLTDRIGNQRTLVGGLAIHATALVLLSTIANSALLTIPLLMLWSFAAWSSGPGMQYNLIELAPEASGIMLSLYGSFIQLGIAAAGGLGGIAAAGGSMRPVGWLAAVSVGIAAVLAVISFSDRSNQKARYVS